MLSIQAAAISPDGSMFAFAEDPTESGPGRIEIWGRPGGEDLGAFGIDEKVSELAFAPDSKTLYGVRWYGRIFRWDAVGRGALPAWSIASPDDFAGRQVIAFGPGGSQLAIASEFDPATGVIDWVWTLPGA